jgi:glycosyltransferase involved in cell wall biosynthesis
MVRCGWAVDTIRESATRPPVIFDAIDAMGLHFDSAARSSLPPLSYAYRAEAGRCRRREHELADAAAMTVAVSERDVAALSGPEGRRRAIPVAGREVAKVVSPGVDPIVVLSGNLGYRPTVRGALWFAREVWPRLGSAVPEARWVLAGARPTAAIRRLARLPGVEVHADVPDLASFLVSSRVAIAPMGSGSGVPMKVLEAMAAGVPAVVHPWAAEGLVGEAGDAVAVASGADEWVASLEPLLRDAGAAHDLGDRGHQVWQRFYHPARVAEQIRDVVAEAVR